ncbi:serine/threonine kinase [Minicystis rosea]|nr:serine/threonine kinase [Minicystis rosea]
MRARSIIFSAAAIALLAAVILFARSRAEPPARCAAGMIALGPRCCGEGQHLEGDRCAGPPTRCAAGMEARPSGCVAPPRTLRIEGGLLRVGPGDWEAQGVVTPYETTLAPFGLDAIEVTEDRWSTCITAGACPSIELSGEPGRAVSRVTLDEAARFCRWAGGSIPSSDQLAFAAAGKSGRRYAWGDTGAVCRRASWGLLSGPCAWSARGPELAGSHPDGASPEGARDLAGNVAEWAIGRDGAAEVRGGSYADGAASAIRSWQRRIVPPTARTLEVGFRCVYPAL